MKFLLVVLLASGCFVQGTAGASSFRAYTGPGFCHPANPSDCVEVFESEAPSYEWSVVAGLFIELYALSVQAGKGVATDEELRPLWTDEIRGDLMIPPTDTPRELAFYATVGYSSFIEPFVRESRPRLAGERWFGGLTVGLRDPDLAVTLGGFHQTAHVSYTSSDGGVRDARWNGAELRVRARFHVRDFRRLYHRMTE